MTPCGPVTPCGPTGPIIPAKLICHVEYVPVPVTAPGMAVNILPEYELTIPKKYAVALFAIRIVCPGVYARLGKVLKVTNGGRAVIV